MDDIVKTTVKFNQGHVDVLREQINARAILEENERLRIENVVRKTDGVRWGLRIPELDLLELQRKNPSLNAPDPVERRNAWHKFCRSPESLPYRVMEKI